MDKLLRPEPFDVDPTSTSASKEWAHWKTRFETFLDSITDVSPANKKNLLINHVSTNVFSHISDAADYDACITALDNVYTPAKNIIFARHLLTACKQRSDESVDSFFQRLKSLAKDCEFGAVTAAVHQEEAIRESFLSGLWSSDMRQKLLEGGKAKLTEIHTAARAIESARIQAQSYLSKGSLINAIARDSSSDSNNSDMEDTSDQVATVSSKTNSVWQCYYCGGPKPHAKRSDCPATNSICTKCGIKGHFPSVCKGKLSKGKTYRQSRSQSSLPRYNGRIDSSAASFSAASPPCLSKSISTVTVNGCRLEALIDSGSSATFLNHSSVKKHGWTVTPGKLPPVSMASSTYVSHPVGHSVVDVDFNGELLSGTKVAVLKDLCADMIIGLDILSTYQSVTLQFGGRRPPAVISAAACPIKTHKLFNQLEDNCQPISIKSRRYSDSDKRFIKSEVKKLLEKGVIEECSSPWRAQVLVHQGNENHKKRLVIDYSQTINKFTKLDAYPVPRIDEMVEEISKYKFYTTLDLSSAYHQIPICEDERPFTAFEANGKLYQFLVIPFGVTNGVSCFQRTVDDIVTAENLTGIYVYVDNITVTGMTQEEHDRNLKLFMSAASKYKLEFNDSKTVSNATSINLLGYLVSQNSIKPDPERIKPLLELPAPRTDKALKSALGLFSHYSRWVKNFSEKIHPLTHASPPLSHDQTESFELIKSEIAKSVLATPDPLLPYTLETDASDYAIGATLNQSNRPVAFFSRTLNASERNHHSVEKEAYAIVESIRKWKHYLLGSQFTVITDQQSVAFMFGKLNHGKIKNDKIARWRIELSPYGFDIIHRPGKDNLPADALSRMTSPSYCSAITDLKSLHDQLCHPGISRLAHFVRSRNLPFSMEDIKSITKSCRDCAEVKPNYFKPQEQPHLIKATAPFERLNLDFKGPLPTNTKNKYILTVVDEYSRYPFAFPCPNTSTQSVIQGLESIIELFGMPSYIHSDQGSGFMSAELKSYLLQRGIASSHSSRYRPQGNGQVEKYNGTIWKATLLALKTRNLPIQCWEMVLHDVLHSIRSLLCTATNETPHERLFNFPRKSTTGTSLPAWLLNDSKALMKRHTNQSKYEPYVEEVDLLDVNPNTSHVRTAEGVELTVSNRHLAPIGSSNPSANDILPIVDSNSAVQNPGDMYGCQDNETDKVVQPSIVVNDSVPSNPQCKPDSVGRSFKRIKPVISLPKRNIGGTFESDSPRPTLRRSSRNKTRVYYFEESDDHSTLSDDE